MLRISLIWIVYIYFELHKSVMCEPTAVTFTFKEFPYKDTPKNVRPRL